MRWGRRNPRRFYDKEGREQPPGRVGTLLPGYVVEAHCAACQHRARIDLSRWPLDFPLPDIALHLKCSACGTKGDLVSIQLCQAENPFAGTPHKKPPPT